MTKKVKIIDQKLRRKKKMGKIMKSIREKHILFSDE